MDTADVVVGLRSESDPQWLPIERSPDEVETDLHLLRNECEARAHYLLSRSRSFRLYSYVGALTVPGSFICLVPNLYWLYAKEYRVERLRNAALVKTRTTMAGFWAMAFVVNLFFWPSQYGLRARADRFATHARYYDGLGWDAGVLANELRRGRLDATAMLQRERARTAEALAERRDVEAHTAGMRGEELTSPPPSVARELESAGADVLQRDELSQLLMIPPDGTVESKRETKVVFNSYGVPLASMDASRQLERYDVAASLSPLAQLWHRMEERRYALAMMR